MMQDITPPASAQSLKDAAHLAINNIEGGLEPLTTPEAQAFSSWLHAVYLSIFLHVDDDRPVFTLLHRRIERMAEQGVSVLTSAALSGVADLAHQVTDGFYLRATAYPTLNSQALFSLAARLPLGPLTKALVAWVDIAYGTAPRDRTIPFVYFGINANGSLNPDVTPVVESFRRDDMSPNWLRLPAFWRVLYAVSKSVLPYKGSVDCILNDVVSASALPLDPYFNDALSFTNYVAILKELDRLFATEHCGGASDHVINRLLQPWTGTPIRGARYAEDWVRWMQAGTLDQDAFRPDSIYKAAFLRLVTTSPLTVRTVSLEAVTADADPNPPEKPADPNPDPDKPDPKAKPTPPTDGDMTPPADADDPNPPPAEADPNAPAATQENDENNSIGNITLEKDSDPGRAYLYRRAVLALDDVLGRDPHIEVDQTARESLHLWCRDWLWLASVTQTEGLIKALGLQKTLGLIGK